MAGDLQDLSEDVAQVVRSITTWAERFLERAQQEVATRAISNRMRDAGKSEARSVSPGFNPKTGPGSLRIVSGRLERSLQGARTDRAAPEGISRIQVTPRAATLTFGSKVEYAAIHEYGGSIPVTDSMRRFFWARYIQTEAEGWKRLALAAEQKSAFRIPARPYLQPAMDSALPKIREIGEETFTNLVVEQLNA